MKLSRNQFETSHMYYTNENAFNSQIKIDCVQSMDLSNYQKHS